MSDQHVHTYQNGVWTAIPIDQIYIQARGPDGPIELSIEALATLIHPSIEEKIDAELLTAVENPPFPKKGDTRVSAP